MKVYKTKTVKMPKLSHVLCNKCKASMVTECSSEGRGVHIEYIAGFDTEYFKDGDEVSLDLCEKCLADLIKHLKIPVSIKNQQIG